MNQEGSLHEIFAQYPNSGLLSQVASLVHEDLEQLRYEIEKFLEFADSSQNVKKKLPLILINFSSKFSARCDQIQETEIIEFSKGTLLMFLGLFNLLMSKPSFLPKIGNSKIETENSFKLSDIPTATEDFEKNIIKPKCEIRSSYALVMTKLSIFYIFAHELAHLRRGHLSIRENPAITSSEITVSEEARENKELIELDADSVACNLCLLYLNQIQKKQRNILT